MIIEFLEIFLIALLASLVISYVFKKKRISKVWLTYVVDIIVFIIFLTFNSLAVDVFLKAGLLYLFIIWLFVFFIVQTISNFLIIGNPFIKGKEIKPSSDVLDDGFIK